MKEKIPPTKKLLREARLWIAQNHAEIINLRKRLDTIELQIELLEEMNKVRY